MKKTKIVYWIFTGLMTASLGIGSIFDAISAPEAVAHVTRIGYPAYIVPFLGYAKLLGIIAILVPGYARIKEWAYAGLMIDLVGASYSHLAFGDGPEGWAFMIIFMVIVMGSYVYRHKLLKEVQTTAPEQKVSMA
jgi:hypothetical protein